MSQQLNLFNPIFLRQKKYFSTRTMVRGLGVVLAGLIVVYGFQRFQLAHLQSQLVEAGEQQKKTQEQLVSLAQQAKRGPSQTLQHEAASLEAKLQAQSTVLEDLESGELGNSDGFSQYFAALARQNVAGVWLTGFTATGTEGPLIIKGRLTRAELLPTYLRALNREEVLRGRGFAQLELTTPAPQAQIKDEPPPQRFVEFTLGATKKTEQRR